MRRARSIFVLCAALSSGDAGGSTVLYVSKIGSERFPYSSPSTAARTISAAVEAAQPGDIIDVAAGEYVEEVNLKEGVILWGWGADRSIVRKPLSATCAIRGAARAEIRGISVLGDDQPGELWLTAGIALGSGMGQLIDGCAVRGWFGHGVYGDDLAPGEPQVVRNTVVSGCDNGISFQGPGACVVDNCNLQNCNWNGISLRMGISALLAWTSVEASRTGVSIEYILDLHVVSCKMSNNRWAGVWAEDGPVSAINCLVWGSENGVAMGFGSQVDLVHCTVTQCQRAFHAAEENKVTLSYSIVWGNAEDCSWPVTSGLISEALASDMQGVANPDKWNIDAEPLFRDAQNGDFHLTAGSPCIDVECGWDCYMGKAALIELDLDGRPRHLFGGRGYRNDPDMGAYEFYINDLDPGPTPEQTTFTWSSLADKTYSIFYSDDLLTWLLAVSAFPSAGNTTTSWTDDGSLTGLPPFLVPRRFYRVLENP